MSLQDELLGFANSVGDMFRNRVAATPDALAFMDPDRSPTGPNTWRRLTWGETRVLVDQLAAGLLSRGIGHEERVGIISTTRLEWILLDLAIACAAGATTTVYPNTAEPEVEFILSDSGSVMVVVENATQLAKVQASEALRGSIHTIVVLDADGVDLDERILNGLVVLHYDNNVYNDLLEPGMTLTIEPMINLGDLPYEIWDDGWTVVNKDGKFTAQFEHTIVITESGNEILTLPDEDI